MLPAAEVYRRALKACKIQAKKPRSTVRWFSTVHPRVDLSATREAQAREYWVANMLESVSFSLDVSCKWLNNESDVCIVTINRKYLFPLRQHVFEQRLDIVVN
jgi:hypothetical protein